MKVRYYTYGIFCIACIIVICVLSSCITKNYTTNNCYNKPVEQQGYLETIITPGILNLPYTPIIKPLGTITGTLGIYNLK